MIPHDMEHCLGWNPQVIARCENHFPPIFPDETQVFSPFLAGPGLTYPGRESAGGAAERHGPETGPERRTGSSTQKLRFKVGKMMSHHGFFFGVAG